jgi:acyl carrier protein
MKHVPVTEEKVLEEVKKAIVETLGIDPADVEPESSLIRDLGAESLDFLDINYRLEQAFGIKMARRTMLEHIEELFGEDSAIDEEGRITDKAIQLLQLRFADAGMELTPGMDMDEVPAVITVRSIAHGVMDVLASLPATCPSCGQGAWVNTEGSRVQCASCGAAAPYANGDDLVRAWLTRVQAEKKIF